MKQDHRPRQGFEDRLLTELKRVVVERSGTPSPTRVASREARRRPGLRRRVAASVGIAAALAVMLAIVLPALGGETRPQAAWAVTENGDGSVTVEVWSIEDADGLEQKLEAAGVLAAVHFLPPGKLCNPRLWRIPEPPQPDQRLPEPPSVVIDQNEEGAFTFTIGKNRPSERTLLIYSRYDVPERGQQQDLVASIATEWANSDVERCELADGSVQGWPFQEGAPSPGGK